MLGVDCVHMVEVISRLRDRGRLASTWHTTDEHEVMGQVGVVGRLSA